MLDEMIKNTVGKIEVRWKLAFFSAFFFGVVTHLYKFTNILLNHDTVSTQYHRINVITSGRWFLTFAGGLSSYFDLPWILGLLSVLYLSFLSVIVIEFYTIKSKSAIVLCSGLIMTFPVTSAILSYETFADAYFLGMVMAALAPLLSTKFLYKNRWKGIIISGILLGTSMGIYQSNITFCISLILVWIIQQICWQSKLNKRLIKSILNFLFSGLFGAVFYYICLNICFIIEKKGFGTYQGMKSIGKVVLSQYQAILMKIYQEFLHFFFEPSNSITLYGIINLLLILVIVAEIVKILGGGDFRSKKSLIKLSLAAICLLLLPLSNYLYYFISPDVKYHKLMLYGLISVYFLIIIDYDRFEAYWIHKMNRKWIIKKQLIKFLLLGVMIFNFMLIDNIAYYNMNLRCQRDYALSVRILNRMEMLDGFEKVNRFAIIGSLSDQYYNTAISSAVSNRIPELTGMVGDRILYADYQYEQYYDSYMGINFEYASTDQINEIKYTKKFKDMGNWPSKDSVAIIDDIIVVKFSN